VIFTALPLPGAFRLEPELVPDERGFFARLWCADEFAAQGLRTDFVQSSVSFNRSRGTLRGLHYQLPPHAETKVVRCIRGAVFDCLVDLRPDSPTYRHWHSCELSAENRHSLYIPEGVAHGFQTLVDDTELLYEITAAYAPAAARGIRWNDPAFAIEWPMAEPILSARDQSYPNYEPHPVLIPNSGSTTGQEGSWAASW
jgi:dTDP-4-dehydrorhamnose 3,5-epimerase